MIAVKLNVHGPDFDRHVYDYFADWFSEWKLKHFCDTTGMQKQYDAGTVDATNNALVGKTGYVRLTIENNPQYGEQNKVDDYVVVDGAAAKPARNTASEDDVRFDDLVP